ncbi:16S rRNA (adenine(1518)-N(6)/adenine(1519)-N(6))-dimethyltransferase RsmA [Candidatus Neomarinimicrobiota bacterium]
MVLKVPWPPIRKKWGQHFLNDPNVIAKIIETIQPGPEESFLEIGPGHGELTLPLAANCIHVTAVEIDPMLVERLRGVLPGNVGVIRGDILDQQLPSILAPSWRIYGSLPYMITSPLLFRLLEIGHLWRDAHFIVQKEVAQRMVSEPGSKVYGRLSVMVQTLAEVICCFDLSPNVFHPRPQVASSLVRLAPKSLLSKVDRASLEEVVRLAFNQRRKRLGNALKALDLGNLLGEMGLTNLRAEQVGVADFLEIVKRRNLS